MHVLIGYFGAILFILSYFLLSGGWLTADRPWYQIMNVIAALCLVYNASIIYDPPTLLVNGIWFLIGMYGLFRIIKKKIGNV